jgi:SAM-dependent methyltransferase
MIDYKSIETKEELILTPQRSLSHQKVCDIYDLFHPEVDQILRGELKSSPFGSRRAWEFAMIFRSLRFYGKLNDASHGIGMGAGTEKLIYALVPHVKRLLVTDLYLPDSRWVGVRTNDPKDLVMKKAPWPIDESRLDVRAMDMRHLECPDNTFDFAWSTGAIEHIGNDQDFAQHLAEVHRVLKPGGMYVFTTAVVFGAKTLAIPNNYYFHPEHLVDLLHASSLHPDPEFDCRIADHIFNRPHPERFQDYGLPAASKISKPIVSFRRGALLAANVMSLTKDTAKTKTRPMIIGYKETTARLARERSLFTNDLWRDFQLISFEAEAADSEYATQPQWFAKSVVEIDMLLALTNLPRDGSLTVRSRLVDDFGRWDTEHSWSLNGRGHSRFCFAATENKLYMFVVESTAGAPKNSFVLRARHRKYGEVELTESSNRSKLGDLSRRIYSSAKRRLRNLI